MFFKKLFEKTLIYKFVMNFVYLVEYIKDYNTVAKFLYGENFRNILLKYLNKPFKIDWIGRLYGIINPNIDIDGKYNFNNTIIELDDDRTNNEIYVQNWIYKQLQLVGDIFKINNLYQYISLKIKHVGPKNADNYLVIFDITSRVSLVKNLRNTLLQLLIYIVIALLIFLIL